jgi:hypothetical protein
MALESTQPLTEMSTRNLPGGKQTRIEICEVRDASGYTYDMNVYLGKHRKCREEDFTATRYNNPSGQ